MQTVNASCGNGEHLISGGFKTQQEGSTLAFVGYTTSRKASGSWSVTAINTDDQAGSASAITYCR